MLRCHRNPHPYLLPSVQTIGAPLAPATDYQVVILHHCLHRSLHLRLEAVQAKIEGMKHREKLFSMFHPAYIHSRKAPPTPMKPQFFATRTVYLCSRLHKYAKQGATVAEKDGKKHKRKDSLPQVPVFSKKPFTFSQKACVFFAELPPGKLHIYAYCRAQVPPPAPRPSVRVRRFPRPSVRVRRFPRRTPGAISSATSGASSGAR